MYDEVLEERSDARAPIIRKAVIYTPGALLATGLFVLALSGLISGNLGALLPLVLLSMIGFALIYEANAALRDLRAEPIVTIGEVDRVWKKSKLLIFGRQDYLLVERRVFEVGPITATELSVGQTVSVEHWPHTMRIVRVERLRDEDKS